MRATRSRSSISPERARRRPRHIITGFNNDWAYLGNTRHHLLLAHQQRARPGSGSSPPTFPARPRRSARSCPKMRQTLDGASIVGNRLIAQYLSTRRARCDLTLDVRPHRHDPAARRRSAMPAALPAIRTAARPSTASPASPGRRPSTATTARPGGRRRSRCRASPSTRATSPSARSSTRRRTARGCRCSSSTAGRDLRPANPTLLYGYGGFNASVTAALLSRAGWPGSRWAASSPWPTSAAAASTGKAWHDGGRLANKQNVLRRLHRRRRVSDRARSTRAARSSRSRAARTAGCWSARW